MSLTDELLDAPVPTPPETVRDFERDGFVKLRGVLDPATVRAYEPEITGTVLERNTVHAPMAERSTTQRAFLQVGNVWRHSERARRLVFSRRLAAIAADLLQVDAVRLFADQALYKEPGGGITPWHADQYYWPLSSDRVCTAWIPLQDTPLEMGPLSFAAGSHRFEFGRDMPISDESERAMQQALSERDFPVECSPYAAGDVSFHVGWIFHRAERNLSEAPRRVLTVIYMDADITVAPLVRPQQQRELDLLMTGARIGEVPDTPSNPVLFRR
ncbi:phytanoyl-CoA dioxygenase family protein [Allonocardiopsis opalescens]|uniref:Ectoine hydroxylase-related dioxygenase (Phytanoyl-CoA dioxygenase family) n=1 Tax=Allonocardiopsis opalescens TaxID=1144618 RepID=A0A2T0Q9D4_9ACTN|nr:phytanoyl-CoA dioxygenase family protein [Allonocardiopsis opalescens]PRY00478.1 ectoine hydroxylase-related dioxygenase (phytanoyl-CoA dioxygenase family) [Allonocardiopsis opalescens]